MIIPCGSTSTIGRKKPTVAVQPSSRSALHDQQNDNFIQPFMVLICGQVELL